MKYLQQLGEACPDLAAVPSKLCNPWIAGNYMYEQFISFACVPIVLYKN